MLSAKITALAALLACVTLTQAQSCPPAQELAPCTCQPTPAPATTTCRRLRHLRDLRRVFRDTLDYPLPRIDVEASHLPFFPSAALGAKSVRHLEIRRSVMVSLFDRVPEENDKLQKITLYNTKLLRRVDWKLFRNFRALTHLQISGTKIGRIGHEFRENIPASIDYLMLGDVRIAWLDDRVFERLTKATHLQVSGGRIRTLKRTMFPKENRLNGLGFNDNRISHLPEDIFSDMPKLRVLYLDGNRFTTLSEKVFKDVYERNVMLTFTKNPFLCDCGIRWIVLGKKGRLDAKCALPHSLKGKSLQEIPTEALDYCKHV